jgi:hypothetical protein
MKYTAGEAIIIKARIFFSHIILPDALTEMYPVYIIICKAYWSGK